jgi:hypothetical protein
MKVECILGAFFRWMDQIYMHLQIPFTIVSPHFLVKNGKIYAFRKCYSVSIYAKIYIEKHTHNT